MSTNQCPYCHEWFFGSHICRATSPNLFKPLPTGGKIEVAAPLTEADVRRIVREELAKATGEQP